MRWPAFHRPNAMLASRCAWFFSSDNDLHLVHSICITDGSPNNQQFWRYGSFVVGEKQSHCRSISITPECAWYWGFPRENCPFFILAAAILLGGMDSDADLSISVRLVICSAEMVICSARSVGLSSVRSNS